MRRILAILLTTLLTAGLFAFTATAPATAATNKLKIEKIKAKKAAYGKKSIIRPKVTRAGNVELRSAKLAIKKRGKTISKNRNRVGLKAGKYRVTTTLKYRTWQNKTRSVNQTRKTLLAYTTTRSMQCTVTRSGSDFAADCTNPAIFDGTYVANGFAVDDGAGNWTGYLYDGSRAIALGTDIDAITGRSFIDDITPTRDLYKREAVRQAYRAYSGVKTKSRTQVLVVKQKAKKKKPASGGGGSSNNGTDPRFEWCYEANDAGYGNYVQGVDAEYDWYEDRDGDGIVCEF